MNKEIIGLIISISCFFLVGIAMIRGYSLIVNFKERIFNLEKKNGREQHQIDELKKKIKDLEKKDAHSDYLIKKLVAENKNLHRELEELKTQLNGYQRKPKEIEY
jgi:peptidoglycan hydrolase CwlO-like protein